MSIGPTPCDCADICYELLQNDGHDDILELFRRLDEAVKDDYEVWLKDYWQPFEVFGYTKEGLAPPNDRTTYILDYVLSYALRKAGRIKNTPTNLALIEITKQLGTRNFFCLLVCYAFQNNDHDALASAFHRVWKGPSDPYWVAIESILNVHKGGEGQKVQAKQNERGLTKNQRQVIANARRLYRAGNPMHEWAGIIASQVGVSDDYARRIFKKNLNSIKKKPPSA